MFKLKANIIPPAPISLGKFCWNSQLVKKCLMFVKNEFQLGTQS
jgi:hypothetical protein